MASTAWNETRFMPQRASIVPWRTRDNYGNLVASGAASEVQCSVESPRNLQRMVGKSSITISTVFIVPAGTDVQVGDRVAEVAGGTLEYREVRHLTIVRDHLNRESHREVETA